MKIGQYCNRHRYKLVELEHFWQAFASRRFVSDSWAFLVSFSFGATVQTGQLLVLSDGKWVQ